MFFSGGLIIIIALFLWTLLAFGVFSHARTMGIFKGENFIYFYTAADILEF